MELNHDPVPPALAPGCYASPTVFSHDSEVCKLCPTFTECAEDCVKALQVLRSRINVEDILARHRKAKSSTIESAVPSEQDTPAKQPEPPKKDFSKFLPSVKKPPAKVERKAKEEKVVHALTPEHEALVAPLNVKTKDLAIGLIRRGMLDRIREDLRRGINPFASEPRQSFLSVTCQELLNGTVTKLSLKKTFMAKLGNKTPWSAGTANSHVNQALELFIAIGAVQETSKGFQLTP